MERPIISGTETEFAIMVKGHADDRDFRMLSFAEQRRVEEHTEPGVYRTTAGFRSDGSKLATDAGAHTEFSTAEYVDDIWGTVTHEIAGEQIVAAGLNSLVADSHIHSYSLNKRLVDDEGHAWGHHENIGMRSDEIAINESRLALIGVHSATNATYLGAGTVAFWKNGHPVFRVSQKGQHLFQAYDRGTQEDRPVVNLRDDPLAGENWVRVHDITSDSNMSPWSIWMGLGTDAIVLQLPKPRRALLESTTFAKVAQMVARDPTLKRPIDVKKSKQILPLDLQFRLVEMATDFDDREGLQDQLKPVLAEWQRVVDDLRAGRTLELLDRVEWIAKKTLMERYIAKHKGEPQDNVIIGLHDLDYVWDEISERGTGMKLRKGIWAKWTPEPAAVKHAKTTPPPTRAKIRGDHVKNSKGKLDVGWDGIKDAHGRVLPLLDPIVSKLSEVQDSWY
jgi:proteasome accessory factor A